MRYITMFDREHPHTARYVTLAVIILVVALSLFPLLNGLGAAGFFGEKTYLVVLQDNSEIRPTGGIMSIMGVLTIRDGHIAKLQYYYSHTSPTLKATVPLDGPESLTTFFNVNTARLYDTNVQYDFASFAPKMQSDWYSVTGQKLDGVIVLDWTAIEAILSITGPITASGDIITNRNVFHRLEYYSATSKGDQMANLLSTLTYATFSLIVDASVPQKLALYNSFRTLANEKHLFVYPDQGLLLGNAGGTSRAPESDLVSVVDFNLGNGKSDFGINRTIDYHVELLPDGSTVSNLTLTYANGDWWASDLFAQALVPPGAKLTAVHNVSRQFDGPEITNGNDYTVFSSRFIVSPYSTARITYLYTVPGVVHGNGVASYYDLYVVKQGGINRYTLNASVQLPAGAKLIHAENVGSNLVFTDDAHVNVVYL
ncbi:MAG: DUF4012 domain-containing protein [Halobacteriota archaeon]